jgi:hypothetical protein
MSLSPPPGKSTIVPPTQPHPQGQSPKKES